MTIPVVSSEELQRLWEDNGMSAKRAANLFREIIAYETVAKDPNLAGVKSIIIKLLTPNGQHIGTVHDIINADNTLRESHPHDYTLRDCTRVRIIQKQEREKHGL